MLCREGIVSSVGSCAVAQAFVLVEQRHGIFHSPQSVVKFRNFVGGILYSGPNLCGREGIHHLIHHDVSAVQDAVCLIVIVIYILCAGMQVIMLCLDSAYIILQFCYIGADGFGSFCPALFEYIQRRYVAAAADTYSVFIGRIISGVCDIELSAPLEIFGSNLRNCNFIPSYFQVYCAGEGAGFCMVLCKYKLQAGILSGSQCIMPYIYQQGFAHICGFSKRLPCIQAAKSQMGIFPSGDPVIYFISRREICRQDFAGSLYFQSQFCKKRMFFTCCRIRSI